MGRKAREERQERREDVVAKRTQAKRKTTLMAAGILALIADCRICKFCLHHAS